MQVGDIVLLKGGRKKSTRIVWGQNLYVLSSKIVTLCSEKESLLYTPYSHVAMYIGNGTFIEALPYQWNGVRFSNYSDIFNNSRTKEGWKVFRNNKFVGYKDEILKKVEPFLEKTYSLNFFKKYNEKYFCSQLIFSILKDIPHFNLKNKKSNRVFPTHFYSMIISNEQNYWSDVTKTYKLTNIEKDLLKKISWNHMRELYSPLIDKLYKNKTYAQLRFYELTDGRVSNYTALEDKVLNDRATDIEVCEFYKLNNQYHYFNKLETLLNYFSCLNFQRYSK